MIYVFISKYNVLSQYLMFVDHLYFLTKMSIYYTRDLQCRQGVAKLSKISSDLSIPSFIYNAEQKMEV